MAGTGDRPSRKAVKAETEEQKRREEQREEERRAKRLARSEAARERLARWQARLTREILFAGEGVSGRLSLGETRPDDLARRGLPVLNDAADLAALLGMDMKSLRWLTFHREVASVSHYRQFEIPKANGKARTISAPRPRLRAAQQAIRTHIVSKLLPTAQAQAFVKGRSTITNATPHLKQDLVVKLDVRDFFGTITFLRVRGFFESLGYSGMVATLLALLTTEARRSQAVIDGKTFYVALGPRALPQGAPTSPEITNQIARRLDARLSGFSKKSGWNYTRYADDLTFSRRAIPQASGSAKDDPHSHVRRLLGTVQNVLEGEGLELNPEKVFVAGKGRQQRVTGIVVNERLGIPRRDVRRFRAQIHRATKQGFRDPGERGRMLGYASYVRMVKPVLGGRFLAALSRPQAGAGPAPQEGPTS